ncbi:MAG: site-specific DNA-methyltransferase [Deltaproteobacteria bacterium]|nr:site-specific DNA-methyltransferase [Deltaproteobacteria bacterium]
MRKLYRGDNLEVMRRTLADESVALVYLDPPFNSRRNYHANHRQAAERGWTSGGGQDAAAPGAVECFGDTWQWGEEAERDWEQLRSLRTAAGSSDGGNVGRLLEALEQVAGRGPLLAYLIMMAPRLLELRRVLRPTGSLYLHCDGSASHYLKLLLDAVFGPANFRNEIIWHYYNKYSAGKRLFGKNFDQIFFYSRGPRYLFNPLREPREKPARQLLRENVGGVLKNRKGPDGKVMYRQVVDRKVDSVWKIPCLQPASGEMTGYPTQKPQALLERIVQASSAPGDVVLDPFCGCGTTLHAAEELGRGWIGIDSSDAALRAAENRLAGAFPGLEFGVEAPLD